MPRTYCRQTSDDDSTAALAQVRGSQTLCAFMSQTDAVGKTVAAWLQDVPTFIRERAADQRPPLLSDLSNLLKVVKEVNGKPMLQRFAAIGRDELKDLGNLVTWFSLATVDQRPTKPSAISFGFHKYDFTDLTQHMSH